MATVTAMTAAKTQEIYDASIISGSMDANGHLLLQTRGGTTIDAGLIQSPTVAIDKAYPVGSIYLTTNATNPGDIFGVGTWAPWGSGRVPVGVDTNDIQFDTVEMSGGEKDHVLVTGEIPSHFHSTPSHAHMINHDHEAFDTSGNDGTHAHALTSDSAIGSTAGTFARGDQLRWTGYGMMDGTTGSHAHTINVPSYSGASGSGGAGYTNSVGNGAAHNNLQPYITCFMWKRTA